MIPVIAGFGRSFEGAFAYYFHDKNARTTNRIGWTETLNMLTDCVDKAWKIMAYTAKSQAELKVASGQRMSGARLAKPVFTYSLSWHPEQKPDRATMLQAAKDSMKKLGLEEHEAAIAEHIDEPQPHVHIVVNTVHPLTGLVAKLKYTKRKLSDFAREFQRKENTMYCPKREENYQKRKQGQKTKYVNPVFMEAWENSTNGQEFFALLKEKGYHPAQGRGRLIVVDERGKPINPKRHLPSIDNKAYKTGLADIKPEKLPTAEEAAKELRKRNAKEAERFQKHLEQSKYALTGLQKRQKEAQNKTHDVFQLKMETKRMELENHYRIHEFKRVIKKLEQDIEQTGFWGRLLRKDKRIQTKLDKLTIGLERREKHINKKIDAINADHLDQLQILEHEHQNERKKLVSLMEQWKPAVMTRSFSKVSSQEQEKGRTLPPLSLER